MIFESYRSVSHFWLFYKNSWLEISFYWWAEFGGLPCSNHGRCSFIRVLQWRYILKCSLFRGINVFGMFFVIYFRFLSIHFRFIHCVIQLCSLFAFVYHSLEDWVIILEKFWCMIKFDNASTIYQKLVFQTRSENFENLWQSPNYSDRSVFWQSMDPWFPELMNFS